MRVPTAATLITTLGVSALFLLGWTACRRADYAGEKEGAPRQAKGGTIRLLVAEDPALAAAVSQLRAEWSGQSGWDLLVEEISASELTADQVPQGDAAIFPSALLGSLAERDLIVPIADELNQGGDASWSDIFDLIRSREATWAGNVVAVPFGSPVLTCYYRADLLDRLDRNPPTNWEEYGQLAALLQDRKKLGGAVHEGDRPWHGTLEPLAPGWAGITLLARTAAYASHRGNYSKLFNVDTMEPLIDGPPFVRALKELAAAVTAESLDSDPASVRRAVWEGHCGMALSWPSAASDITAKPSGEFRIGLAELPGSADVYNVSDSAWETRRDGENFRVPLLAAAGRLGAVLRGSPQPDASRELLAWLSDRQWSQQISPASPSTTLFRRSHLGNARIWMEELAPAAVAEEYATLTEQTFSGSHSLDAIRIPGRADYLSVLDEAVRAVVRGDRSVEQALGEAAAQWRKITNRHGLEQQRRAYNNSLGLD